MIYGALNRRGYGQALALAGATPAGAALVVGTIAVPTFYTVAIGVVAALALGGLGQARTGAHADFPAVPASRPLVVMVVVSVLVTLVAPLLFDGLPVQTPTGANNALTAGVITKSNIAQIVYLILSVGIVVYLARSSWTGPELVGTATCVATLLSFWSWMHTAARIPFPEGLFDNSPSFVYQSLLPGGIPRVRGIFSEPAGLASGCIVTVAYCTSRLRSLSGIRRLGLLAVAGVAIFLGSISTSTTFPIAGIALFAIAAFVGTVTFVLRGGSLSYPAITVLSVAAIAALWVLPYIANAVGQQVVDKVASSSYLDRSFADSQSYRLAFETLGIGTGLGSNRASSFLASLLSTVGVVGTLLLAAVVVTLVRRGWSDRRARPAAWALIATLTCKVVSGPDLSDNSGVLLWLSLGVLANAALRLDRHAVSGMTAGLRIRPGRPDPRGFSTGTSRSVRDR